MSIENYSKLETYKGLKKKENDLEKFFVDLKFNNKKPKYNYQSGLTAGMMIQSLFFGRPVIEKGDKADQDVLNKIFGEIIELAKLLVENYNWKLENLNDLMEQVFGGDED